MIVIFRILSIMKLLVFVDTGNKERQEKWATSIPQDLLNKAFWTLILETIVEFNLFRTYCLPFDDRGGPTRPCCLIALLCRFRGYRWLVSIRSM